MHDLTMMCRLADADPDQIERLLRYLDGDAMTEAELESIGTALRDDESMRRMLALLAIQSRTTTMIHAAQAPVQSETPKPTLSPFRGRSVWYVAAAAMIALAVTSWFIFLAQPQEEGGEPSSMRSTVAMLTNLSNAAFDDSSPAMSLGGELAPGRLTLEAGTAQVMFKSGAVVDLNGPCSFELTEAGQAYLHHGLIHVFVPETAHGFTVGAPHGARVVDLGTEFFMYVGPDGTELGVRMLTGSAMVHSGDVSQIITAGQVVQVAGRQISDAPMSWQQRVGLDRLRQVTPTVYLDEPFDYRVGPLNAGGSAWTGDFDVVSPGLSDGSHLIAAVNAAQGAYAQRSYIDLDAIRSDASNTIYISFLAQFSSNAGNPFHAIELYDGPTRRYAIGLLRNDGDSNSARFEHRAYDLDNTATPDLGAFNTEVNLFVVKLAYANQGDMLTIDAWLNPDGATDFEAASNRIRMSRGAFRFDRLAMAAFATDAPVTFDEIRVAEKPPAWFADTVNVSPAPKYQSPPAEKE